MIIIIFPKKTAFVVQYVEVNFHAYVLKTTIKVQCKFDINYEVILGGRYILKSSLK